MVVLHHSFKSYYCVYNLYWQHNAVLSYKTIIAGFVLQLQNNDLNNSVREKLNEKEIAFFSQQLTHMLVFII